jgi:hypothetical protein
MISRGKPSFDVGKQVRARLGVIKRVALGLAFLFLHYPPQPSKEAGGEFKKEHYQPVTQYCPKFSPHTSNYLSYISSRRYWITTVDSYAYRLFT